MSLSRDHPMDVEDSTTLHSLQLSNSNICKENVELSYNCYAILSGDDTLGRQPLDVLQQLYKTFWISRGNQFSLDFNFSFDQSVTEREREVLLGRLAEAFARTKLWCEINLASAVVRAGFLTLSVCLSYDEDSIGRPEGRGKTVASYTSRLIPPLGTPTLEICRVTVDLAFRRLANSLDSTSSHPPHDDFVSIEDMDDSTQTDPTSSPFPDTGFSLVESLLRHGLLGIPRHSRTKRSEEGNDISLTGVCPAMFSPSYLKAMNERSSVLSNIAGSLTRITRRTRSDLSNHPTAQISQRLWKLAQSRLNTKTSSKLSFLEHSNCPKTRKEKLEMSRMAMDLFLLDNDDNDEGFQDVEALVEDELEYEMSQGLLEKESFPGDRRY